MTLRRRPKKNDQLRLHDLANLAAEARVPTVVTNDILFHDPARRILQDVITAIRHNCTVEALGHRCERHADRYLKPPAEMARLFARHPEALARTVEIAERCTFDLKDLEYQYPEERDDPRLSPQDTLARLTWEGAATRYPEGIPPEVTKSLNHELTLIGRLDYAPSFQTVHSIVRYARSQNILCQGRGSAANSAVCYVLGITSMIRAATICSSSASSARNGVSRRIPEHQAGQQRPPQCVYGLLNRSLASSAARWPCRRRAGLVFSHQLAQRRVARPGRRRVPLCGIEIASCSSDFC